MFNYLKAVMDFLRKVQGVCTIVSVQPERSGRYPGLLEYASNMVKAIKPCEVRDGKYYDLRTGEEQTVGLNDEVWPVFTGETFLYPDGEHILVTRFYDKNRSLGLMRLKGDYRPTSMGLIKVKEGKVVTTSYDFTSADDILAEVEECRAVREELMSL